MKQDILAFIADDQGAVTVDMVILVAGIVIMSLGVFSIVTETTFEAAAGRINDLIVSLLPR